MPPAMDTEHSIAYPQDSSNVPETTSQGLAYRQGCQDCGLVYDQHSPKVTTTKAFTIVTVICNNVTYVALEYDTNGSIVGSRELTVTQVNRTSKAHNVTSYSCDIRDLVSVRRIESTCLLCLLLPRTKRTLVLMGVLSWTHNALLLTY